VSVRPITSFGKEVFVNGTFWRAVAELVFIIVVELLDKKKGGRR
jgi:hypothetical protein